MSASEKNELFEYLSNPEVRHAYVDSSIRRLLALKIKALRKARGYSQEELGRLADNIKQTQISRLEDAQYNGMTVATLKRVAKAFDVALLVDLVPFSELVDRTVARKESDFTPPSYEMERKAHPAQQAVPQVAANVFLSYAMGPSTQATTLALADAVVTDTADASGVTPPDKKRGEIKVIPELFAHTGGPREFARTA